ncbi:hypothetical protein MMC11_008278 [Xylographa trunciseda]|nr:hypothetical protein [Xylographa trunciseda]
MDSSRFGQLSSHHFDELDMQMAALEIRARRHFQQGRDLYRHSADNAAAKLQQYCLGLILSHRGPDSAIYAIVEEAARSIGFPVDLWSMDEVKRVWDDIVKLHRAYNQDYQNPPLFTGPEYPKQIAGSVPQQRGGGDATRERAVSRSPLTDNDDLSQDSAPPATKFPWDDVPLKASGKAGYNTDSAPPATKFPWDLPLKASGNAGYNIDTAMAQAGGDLGGLPPPPKKASVKSRSPKELQAETRREQKTRERTASARAGTDKEEDARLEIEADKQRKEDAECAERERAAVLAEEEADKACGVLDPVQQMEMDEARKIFLGELSENDIKILTEAKKEYGDDIMKWGLKETRKTLNKIIMGT